MAYEVRVYCEDEATYKRTEQETLDPDWIPSGCESHTVRDFVVEGTTG